MESYDYTLPATAAQGDVEALIDRLNRDDSVDGMIVQLPLPGHLDGPRAVQSIDPAKDADGLHPYNLGLLVLDEPGPQPATPSGILRILQHYGIDTVGVYSDPDVDAMHCDAVDVAVEPGAVASSSEVAHVGATSRRAAQLARVRIDATGRRETTEVGVLTSITDECHRNRRRPGQPLARPTH